MSALGAPITHHLELFRYWRAKQADRRMPSRSDLDPIEFSKLWPYLILVEKSAAQYRYRLIGSALARQLGRDVTGAIVGSQFNNAADAIAAKKAIYERVFITARPLLVSVDLRSGFGTVHNVLQLLLPLSNNGADVNMVISSLIARFSRDEQDGSDLRLRCVEIRNAADVVDDRALERLCLDWERRLIMDASELEKQVETTESYGHKF
jgi:hypothetical protein